MSVTGINSIISATLSGETDIICDNLTADTITLPSGDLQTTLDNIVAGSGSTGPAGPAGQSVSFYAPNITTLSAGSSATVNDVITVSSNTQYHQLTFNIPKGDPGDATLAEAAAAAAAISAAASAVSAGAAATSAAAAATSASSAITIANAAQDDADTALSRTKYVRTTGSNYTVFTGDNRNNPLLPLVDGGAGIRFYNTVETVFGITTFSDLRVTIGNNGDITQEAGTTTLNDLVVSGTTTGVERLLVDVLDTDSQFCIPFTRDIEIDDVTPLNTRMAVDASYNYNPFTNTLRVPNIVSDLSGSASKIIAASSVLNNDLPIPFLSNTTGSVNVLTDIVNGITYNPSTNILKCNTFVGDLSGNVVGNLTGNVVGNLTGNVLGTTINVGNPASTSEINIEGLNGCNINIGIASFLNNVNIGNSTSTVNIRCITDTAITVFNPFDQMNGVF
jgi:hypothetical protein